MLIKEIRLQGPNLARSTTSASRVKVLIRSGATEQLMVRAQREPSEAKIASGQYNRGSYTIEVTTFFRAVLCTVAGEPVTKALQIIRSTPHHADVDTESILQTLNDPITFISALGAQS